MFVDSYRFGRIELEQERIIQFPEGIPGLEELKGYVLISPEQTRPVYWLQSVEDGDIALPVINTFEILEEYSVDVLDEEIEALKIDEMEDLMVFNVAVIPEDITKMTANLAAPILVNARLGLGKQILIDSRELSTRYAVFGDICTALERGGALNVSADQEG